MKLTQLVACLSALTLAANLRGHAQDNGALLDLLVKRKSSPTRKPRPPAPELAKDYAATPAGKINISSPVKQITLYGDARLRYDYREANALGAPVTKSTRQRECRPVPLPPEDRRECHAHG